MITQAEHEKAIRYVADNPLPKPSSARHRFCFVRGVSGWEILEDIGTAPVAIFQDHALAVRACDALNSEPVKQVSTRGRWEQ